VRAVVCLAALVAPVALAAQDAQGEDAPVYDLAWHNAQQLAVAKLRQEDGWRVLEGGLRYRFIEGDGSGESPTVADTVTVHYAGRLIDGTGFDSSYERGEPATFPLGRLIKAWQLAIPEMGVGDTIELYAPADLAYGPVGKGPIPGNATLIFKVELIAIEE
jgi:FKBP-type peptidyl-prolyl cis-trans isomerase FkpA